MSVRAGRRLGAVAALAGLLVVSLAPAAQAGAGAFVSVTIIKVTDPASDPQDFDFDVSGFDTIDVDLDTDAGDASLQSQASMLTGSGAKSIIESTTPGWVLTDIQCSGDQSPVIDVDTRSVTFNVTVSGTIACTFTNTKLEPAALTIIKVTDPASDPQVFDFDLTGDGLPSDADLDTDASTAGTPSQESYNISNVQLGFHTITESATPGWILTNIACTGGGDDTAVDLADRTVSLGIDAGENITCVFTNTKTSAALTIIKETSPSEHGQDFGFTMASPAGESTFSLDTDPTSDLPHFLTFPVNAEGLGTYTVTEDALTWPWAFFGLSCEGDTEFQTDAENRVATLELDEGDHLVCIFYNYVDENATQPPSTDDPNTDPPSTDDVDPTEPGQSDGSTPDPSGGEGGESDAPTIPGGTDTQAPENAAAASSNLLLLVLALGILGGVLIVTRPKRGRR